MKKIIKKCLSVTYNQYNKLKKNILKIIMHESLELLIKNLLFCNLKNKSINQKTIIYIAVVYSVE